MIKMCSSGLNSKQQIRMNKYVVTVGLIWTLVVQSSAYATEWTYTVRPGDTIWDVVDKYAVNLYYVDKLQRLNGIDDPKRLPIASTLRIPVKWLKREPVSVSVLSISGSVMTQRRDTDAVVTVQAGDVLRSGDTLITGQSGNALLEFADGSSMNVRRASTITFDTLTQFGDTGMVDTRARLQRTSTSTGAWSPKPFGYALTIFILQRIAWSRPIRWRLCTCGTPIRQSMGR